MTLTEAKEVLRVDNTENDYLIQSLVDSIAGYIELTTGMSEDDQDNEPMCQTVGGFLLTLWYYGDHTDDIKLTRTINNLLKTISLKVVKQSNQESSES